MKTAFVNLPYPIPIVRRYRCSYNAPTFLLPPIELMYLEAVARKWNNQKTIVIDAVAEGLNGDQVLDKLKSFGPDLIATITGVESVNTDMAEIRRLKLAMPDVRIVMMGHLVTVFPEEYLNDGIADYIIASEPEETFSELCKKLDSGNSTEKMPGLFSFPEGRLSVGPPRLRMENIDSLPFPDRTLIDNSRYGEPFCKKPFTTMLSSRGCPFNCVYCISTYGDKMSFRSPENILEEIKIIAGSGIRALRFLDDTFNVRTKRVAEICELIISSGIRLEWTCLSRPDTIDPEVLPLMRRAGCIRLYMGIESGSQKMLDLYRRGYDRELA
ncbi:MAG: radical SAM protein, partial [bacterium]